MTTTNGANPNDLYDITIIGAGPAGLFGAFYAGLREMKVKVIDALDELGGQLATLCPEKFIYDVPGYPKVLAQDLVKHLVEQASMFKPTFVLGERVETLEKQPDGTFVLGTNKGTTHRSRVVLICAGVGAFQPKKLLSLSWRSMKARGFTTSSKRRQPSAESASSLLAVAIQQWTGRLT